jgi:hypothetical protein
MSAHLSLSLSFCDGMLTLQQQRELEIGLALEHIEQFDDRSSDVETDVATDDEVEMDLDERATF